MSISNNNRKNFLKITFVEIAIFVVISIISVTLCYLYLNPKILMTNTAKRLPDEKFVEAENAIRGNILTVSGTIFILVTLGINIFQIWISREAERQTLYLALDQFKLEKQKEWRTQAENFYGEWAGIFLSQTRIGIELARAKAFHNTNEIDRLQKIFEDYNFQRKKKQFGILMLETRENVINNFKEINKYALPHDPIAKLSDQIMEVIKKDPEQNKIIRIFWDDLADKDYGTTVSFFYECTEKRLNKFCEWVSNPDEPFEMPNFNDYIDYIKTTSPNLAKHIERINNGNMSE